jgi:hypothetical protein
MRTKYIFLSFLILTTIIFILFTDCIHENLENETNLPILIGSGPPTVPGGRFPVSRSKKLDSNNYDLQYYDSATDIESKTSHGSWLQ